MNKKQDEELARQIIISTLLAYANLIRKIPATYTPTDIALYLVDQANTIRTKEI